MAHPNFHLYHSRVFPSQPFYLYFYDSKNATTIFIEMRFGACMNSNEYQRATI